MSSDKKDKTPNAEIDKALKDLLKKVTDKTAEIVPEDVTARVKVIQTAIQWEKVKHGIRDDSDFDPDAI